MASIEELLSSLQLDDSNGKLTLLRHSPLEGERLAVYSAAFPQLGEGQPVAAVFATDSGERVEHLVLVKGSSAEPVTQECAITLDDLPPSQLVEFQFTATGPWRLSKVCFAALEEYRRVKFNYWRDLMLHPTCEAAFKRMLKLGLICKLYDDMAFPETAEEKAEWEVVDEKSGNLVHLPHPVHALRLWDPENGAYKEVECRLEGAPAAGEEAAFWADFIGKLEENHGKEYLDQLRSA